MTPAVGLAIRPSADGKVPSEPEYSPTGVARSSEGDGFGDGTVTQPTVEASSLERSRSPRLDEDRSG